MLRKDYTETEQKKVLKSINILVDTREHKGKNDHILNYFDSNKIPWIRQKLDAGDYSFMVPKDEELGIEEDISFANLIMVERKANLEEISKGFTTDRDRINREFARSPKNKILLIENAKYSDLVTGRYDTNYPPKSFWASIFSMWHRYDIPTAFIENGKYTGSFIYGYFYYYLYNYLKDRIND